MLLLNCFCFKCVKMTVTILRNPWTVAGIVMVILMVLRTPMAHCRGVPSKCWRANLQRPQIWELIAWVLWSLGSGVLHSDQIPGRIWKGSYDIPVFSSSGKRILLDFLFQIPAVEERVISLREKTGNSELEEKEKVHFYT